MEQLSNPAFLRCDGNSAETCQNQTRCPSNRHWYSIVVVAAGVTSGTFPLSPSVGRKSTRYPRVKSNEWNATAEKPTVSKEKEEEKEKGTPWLKGGDWSVRDGVKFIETH